MVYFEDAPRADEFERALRGAESARAQVRRERAAGKAPAEYLAAASTTSVPGRRQGSRLWCES